MSDFEDVGQFHHQFGLPSVIHDGGPKPAVEGEALDEIMKLRKERMIEELQEFFDAHDAGDHVEMADALVDLVYVVMGTAHVLGYPWEAIWQEVHAANMRKIRAPKDGAGSRYGNGYDVIKPPGWVGPDHKPILERYGWKL